MYSWVLDTPGTQENRDVEEALPGVRFCAFSVQRDLVLIMVDVRALKPKKKPNKTGDAGTPGTVLENQGPGYPRVAGVPGRKPRTALKEFGSALETLVPWSSFGSR